MPTYKQENRPVRIRTPFGDDALLVKSLAGTERLGRPFQYELVLASEGHELDYKKIIGQNVTVFVDKGDKEPRFFNGFISRFAQTKFERKLAEYHATVVPWLWFLTRSSDCRIFQNMSIPEILKQVFEDHGFSDIIDRLHGSYRKWDYCVQYRETAYAFISRLMEEEGIYYYFKHEDGKHSMVLCDSPVSHKQFAGYEDLLYRPTASTTQETLTSWVVQHEVQTAGYVTADFDFTTPKRNPLANSFRDRSHGQSQLEQFDYLGEQSPFSEGERYSKLRLEEGQARHETYSGEGDARGICTGVRFVLKGHPRKEFEKEYLTTGAEYLIHCNSHETADALGDDFKYHSKMTAMLLDDQFRTPRETPKPIVHGPQTAIVVGPASEKIYTDQYGRVKVQFHWDRRGKKDENSSCWVRVSQAWAGKPQSLNWGDMAIPHIGDEVIVECLEGDPDRPIITGRVYNQANMAPLELPANKDKRIMRDDYGNEIVLDATKGDEHIRIFSPHHESLLLLGKSVNSYTDSNQLNASFGNLGTLVGGTNFSGTMGYAATGILGAGLNVILGLQNNLTVGASLGMTIGFNWTWCGAAVVSGSDRDMLLTARKDYIIGAGDDLCIAANTQGTSGSRPVIVANTDGIKLSCGDTLVPKDAANALADWYKPSQRPGPGLKAVGVLLGATISAGCTAFWLDRVKTTSSNSAWENFEAVGNVGTVISAVFAYKLYKSTMTDVKIEPVHHADAATKARIQMKKLGTIEIESLNKGITIQNSSKATYIKLMPNGDIEIKSKGKIKLEGAAELDINMTGQVKLKGAGIAATGNTVKVNNGALEVA